jgi:hypothetical protein
MHGANIRIKELFAQHTSKFVVPKVMDTFRCRRYIILIHVGRWTVWSKPAIKHYSDIY